MEYAIIVLVIVTTALQTMTAYLVGRRDGSTKKMLETMLDQFVDRIRKTPVLKNTEAHPVLSESGGKSDFSLARQADEFCHRVQEVDRD